MANRCHQAAPGARPVRFAAADGYPLVGAELGSGRVGVVLAHQADGDLCEWLPYAEVLARQGLHALIFDFRGFGKSGRFKYGPSGHIADPRAFRLDADVRGAAAKLRSLGASRIVLVGASLGADAVLAAAPEIAPAVRGVVLLPGASTRTMRALAKNYGTEPGYVRLDPTRAASRLHSPLLILVSRSDANGLFLKGSRELFQAARESDKRLIVLPGYSHGVVLLEPGDAASKRVSREILGFIRSRTT